MAGYQTFWIKHDEGDSAEAVQIRVQQMAVVVGRAPLMFVAVAFNSILTALIGLTEQNQWLALPWAAGLTIMSFLAFMRWRSRRHNAPPDYVSPRGPLRLARAATFQGLLWGLGAALLIPAEALPAQSVIGLTVAAMGAGGAMVLSVVPGASIGFTVGCVLPLTIRYVTFEEPIYLMLAAMSGMFVAVLLYMARSVYVSFISSIRAQVANQSLLDELTDARTSLLDAIASTSEGFAQFGPRGRLRVANDRFAELLEISPEDVQRGATFEDLIRKGGTPVNLIDDMVGLERWVRREVKVHETGDNGLIVQMHSGGWIDLHHSRTSQGGTVTTVLDMTELKERENELITARVQAETADRAKSEFLALMSHELRTPLNSILGFSELFMIEAFGKHSDPRYREHAADIHESGSHLLHIINELLDLSKVEAGFFELQDERVDVGEAVEAANRMMGERALTSGVSLVPEVPHDLPPIRSDQRVLRQMLINLVGNAVKFTRDQSSVVVRAEQRPDGGISISVIDKGIGVSPDDIPKIMEPFGQVESGLNRKVQQGTGLGLPLVKQMIELHGGKLDFQSIVGHGTTATLIFPPERTLPTG